MPSVIDPIRQAFRAKAYQLMVPFNRLTGGRVTPTQISVFCLLIHIPIAWLIATNHTVIAAVSLVFFGLFDILDGALAKVQHTTSERGMLVDASTDRLKEVLLYGGAAYALAGQGRLGLVAVAVASGSSISVSYIKAKGEAAVASLGRKIPHAVLNKMFSDGLLTFEIRMTVLAAGLLANRLVWAVYVIAALASFTAVQRLVRISRQL